MEMPKPTAEHHWLQKLVGNWKFDSECVMGPDQPPIKNGGAESVRSLDGLWTVGEGTGDGPDGTKMHTIMTLGFNPATGKFVGTFVASCMTHLWPYVGTLTGNTLTLESEGPSFANDGTMCKYLDIIEFVSDDHRTLTSKMPGPDGQWIQFMKADYRRVN